MRWPLGIFAVSLLAIACSGGSGSSGNQDASYVLSDVRLTLPEVPPGCPPNAGNDQGVGATCTATGGECTNPLTCSCEPRLGYSMPAGMPCFCTNLSFGSTCSNCGSNAPCCTYTFPIGTSNITISACFPSVCAPNNTCPQIQ